MRLHRVHRQAVSSSENIFFRLHPLDRRHRIHRRGPLPGTSSPKHQTTRARSIAWIAWGPPEPQTRVRIPAGPPHRFRTSGYAEMPDIRSSADVPVARERPRRERGVRLDRDDVSSRPYARPRWLASPTRPPCTSSFMSKRLLIERPSARDRGHARGAYEPPRIGHRMIPSLFGVRHAPGPPTMFRWRRPAISPRDGSGDPSVPPSRTLTHHRSRRVSFIHPTAIVCS